MSQKRSRQHKRKMQRGQRKHGIGTIDKIMEILQRLDIAQREILRELSTIKTDLKKKLVGVEKEEEDLGKRVEGIQGGQKNLIGEETPRARKGGPLVHKGKEILMKPEGVLVLWEGGKIKTNNTTKADAFSKKHNPKPEGKQIEMEEGETRQTGRREVAGSALRAEGGEVTRPPQTVAKETRKWKNK